jgi:hypothetical protein
MTPHDARRPSQEFPTNAKTWSRPVPRQKRPRLRPRRPRAARYCQAVDGVPASARGWRHGRQAGFAVVRESGAGDEVIMSIAGHVSHAVLSRYSHVPDGSEAPRPRRDRHAPARG